MMSQIGSLPRNVRSAPGAGRSTRFRSAILTYFAGVLTLPACYDMIVARPALCAIAPAAQARSWAAQTYRVSGREAKAKPAKPVTAAAAAKPEEKRHG